MVDDDESITIDVTEHPVTDKQKAGWEMSYCDKHQVYWVLDEGSCPSCERGAKPISYGKDRNGGVRAIYIHGVEVVGAVLSSEAVDLVDRVNALLRVYDAEIQHALGSVRLLGDERDTLRAENERLRGALTLAVRWLGDPDDPTATFEDIGEWFRRETGYLRPGKSLPMEMGDMDEERRKAWDAWVEGKGREVRNRARAALGGG